MKLLCIASLLTISWGALSAQSLSYTDALQKVMSGNLRLKVENARVDALKLGNNTDLTLPDPEVDFSYQGNPDGSDKKTLDVTQGLDFSILSGAKRKLAAAKDQRADGELAITRNEVRNEADRLMTDIVYMRKKAAMWNEQLNLDKLFYEAVEKQYANGKVNLVDLNAAKMQYRLTENASKINDIDLAASIAQLSRLANGEVAWSESEYMPYSLPSDFNEWCATATNPRLIAADAEINVAEKGFEVAKKEQLPKLAIGYRSEMTAGDNFYGAGISVTLPFWQNRGKTKAAHAAKLAADLEREAIHEEFIANQRTIYTKALLLKKTADEVTLLNKECDIEKGLQKMYNLGQISVTDYLNQLKPMLDMKQRVLESEHDYQLELVNFRALGQ